MPDETSRDLNREFEEAVHTPSNLLRGGGCCSNIIPRGVPMITLTQDQLDALINRTVEKILVERAMVPISIPEVMERVEEEDNAQRRSRGDGVHNRVPFNLCPDVVPHLAPLEGARRRALPVTIGVRAANKSSAATQDQEEGGGSSGEEESQLRTSADSQVVKLSKEIELQKKKYENIVVSNPVPTGSLFSQ